MTKLFVYGGIGNGCLHCLKTWSSCQILSVASLQAQVVRTLMRPVGKETGGEVSKSKSGLKAIDLVNRERESKGTSKSRKIPKTENFKETHTDASPVQQRVSQLKQLSQQLQKVHPNVLAKALHKSIIFQNQDVIAINKPYGVPLHDTTDGTTSIKHVLPVLAKMLHGMRTEKRLHICHSLDKDTTGTLLLAQTEEAANHIHSLFKALQMERKYWAVVVGVPVPSEGVVDIPVIERGVTGAQPHFKMGLSPLFRASDNGEGVTRVRANRNAQSAVTNYRVLDSTHGCSLMELQPVTAVKHQLRVHMAFALGCPILGDHKYAHWNKLAPQQLPERVIRCLGLEQSKARHLPLHLHHRQLTVPGFKGHRELIVSCRLPRFLTSTLQKLRISIPDKKEGTGGGTET
ncbi:pseudouridylate synthase RPUSD4, mitochondrial [Sardina pilchardus]|uniref:pseudouridylate synthase RPUSD4, mitochondrial n=1 Tax=Sardina pilchardus TaxID=27697 RepID=UPI002E0E48B5